MNPATHETLVRGTQEYDEAKNAKAAQAKIVDSNIIHERLMRQQIIDQVPWLKDHVQYLDNLYHSLVAGAMYNNSVDPKSPHISTMLASAKIVLEIKAMFTTGETIANNNTIK